MHGEHEACALCQDGDMTRGGKSVEHLFTCNAAHMVSARARHFSGVTFLTPEVLWIHPRDALKYAQVYIDAKALQALERPAEMH
jgi:hypothetical protein